MTADAVIIQATLTAIFTLSAGLIARQKLAVRKATKQAAAKVAAKAAAKAALIIAQAEWDYLNPAQEVDTLREQLAIEEWVYLNPALAIESLRETMWVNGEFETVS